VHIQPSDPAACCGCGACLAICPVQAIGMVRNQEGFDYPEVDSAKCVRCGQCRRVCPWIERPPAPEPPYDSRAYAAWHLDPQIRAASSSGGVFTALAEQVVAGGGLVSGAIFNPDFTGVRHLLASTARELPLFRTSKYVQSDIGTETYHGIRQALDAGHTVLFSGCPCQVAGLRLFLQSDYPNLLTCAVACHGISSPGWFQHYRAQCDIARESPVVDFSFRNKAKGWKKFQIRQVLRNGQVLQEYFGHNYFMWSFLRNLCLRYTCYECRYKGDNMPADILLADFWGVGSLHSEFDTDDRGTSLVVLITNKGFKAIEDIADRLFLAEVDFESAIGKNPPIRFSFARPPLRRKFLRDAFRRKLPVLMKKYPISPAPSLWVRGIGKARKLLRSWIKASRSESA